MHAASFTAISFVLLYAFRRFVKYRKAVRSVNNLPGYRMLFPQSNLLNFFLWHIPGVIYGKNHTFLKKHQDFESFGCDIYSCVTAWPTTTRISLADAEAIKEVSTYRSRFPKGVHHYAAFTIYGQNIVASEGEEWKKHRKISAPFFSDKNNKLVWDETVKVMESLFDDVWGSDEEVVIIDDFLTLTSPIALFVIGAIGFGIPISWNEERKIPDGHQISFGNALRTVAEEVLLKLIIPHAALGMTKRLRDTQLVFDELGRYMTEMVEQRQRSNTKVERYDLFSSLLEANETDTDDAKLDMSELIGSVFIFLLAGHETTANTLCFAIHLLALYSNEQEILYQHIQSIISSGAALTWENMPLFTYSMAVFNETLRMFPPVTGLPKMSAKDTTLTTTDAQGHKIIVAVPKGADVFINTPGLHYNTRYWEDPHTFKPSRFLGDWPRDAFLPFSAGARACTGRRFAETEGVVVLSMLVSRYKIEVKEEPQFAHETFEQRKERVLATKHGLSLIPVKVPLVFKLRDSQTP